MKGIILAGGKGTRLYPLTKVTNKHLLPVGKEPMIFNPIKQLISAGITDILIVTSTEHMGDIVSLLGSGEQFGADFTYKVQETAYGIAHALRLGESFANRERITVVLGDNIAVRSIKPYVDNFRNQKTGARVLLKEVSDPARYGIAALDEQKIVEIAEKPGSHKTNFAVIGYYMYDEKVFDFIRRQKLSERGEFEITDVNNEYIKRGEMEYDILEGDWTDAGTFESLQIANQMLLKYSNKVNMLDSETNLEIGDPYKLPFEKYASESIDEELQKNVEKRLKFGIASASGIRQIFDNTYGDEETEYVDGTGTEITDAAKVHIATITDCFVELLQKETGQQQPAVVVAMDSRHTGPAIADVAIRILAYHGAKIRYTFITPVTETAVYSREISDGFIYVSASHNPRGYNGLKLGLNDGRVLPRHLALPFIESYQTRLRDPEHTETIVGKANAAKPDRIREIYSEIDHYRSESRRIYAEFSDMIITGVKDPQKAAERKSLLKKEIQRRNIRIGVDPNGGARKDREYLESWGFNVIEINSRPRLDMVHDLAPTPSACEQAREAMLEAQKEAKNIIAFLVFDTDGDRKNIVIPDGKDGAAIPGVQTIFALDVLCGILDAVIQFPISSLGAVVNGPTSSVIEQLAHHLGFRVKRVEAGEANVGTGGQLLSEQGVRVPILGEGSNGGAFNLDLLVREPLHTLRTLINFITRPELTRLLLNRLHQEDKYDDWHSSERINSLFMNIINVLPPSVTTDFFTDEGIRRSEYDVPQDLFKAAFDEYFESQLWPEIAQEIRREYDGEPLAEFVNYEGENELRGKGNRKTNTGGYKIEFYVHTQDGEKRHVGWIWFRPSGTERGVMRRGVSISHWETTQKSREVVERLYSRVDEMLTDALNVVEKQLTR